MRRLLRFFRLRAADQWLLVKAVALLAVVRISLWILPFRVVRRLVRRFISSNTQTVAVDVQQAQRIAWAITRGSRCVPEASCLTQALSAQVLLSRAGVPARLHIGVARDERERFTAHAWVTCGEWTVVGGGAGQFTPILQLERGDL